MQIGEFDIIKLLGRSIETEVWLGYQRSLKREVLIKTLREDFADKPAEVEQFVSEAKTAARLKHAGIVQVYDINEADGRPFLVMEHVGGTRLADRLCNGRPLDTNDALALASQVADALQHAWEHHRLPHRHLTPKSIMLADDGTAKVAYMGMSLRVDPTQPTRRLDSGMIQGNPHYMAPEQVSGHADLDCRTDMYSLGAILYHAVTGRLPFEKHDDPADVMEQQISGFLRHPQELVPGVSPSLAHLIRSLMMKQPAHRFPDWNAIKNAIKRPQGRNVIVIDKRGKRISTVSPLNRHPRRRRYRIASRATSGGAPPSPTPPPRRRRIASG